MTINDLTREQIEQLKIRYYDDLLQEKENRSISYGEIIAIDVIVDDETIYNTYDMYEFCEDDFY